MNYKHHTCGLGCLLRAKSEEGSVCVEPLDNINESALFMSAARAFHLSVVGEDICDLGVNQDRAPCQFGGRCVLDTNIVAALHFDAMGNQYCWIVCSCRSFLQFNSSRVHGDIGRNPPEDRDGCDFRQQV